MLQLRTVNKALKNEGIKAELIKGEGYLYFIGDDVELCYTTSVYVPRLNDLPLEVWMKHARGFKIENEKFRETLKGMRKNEDEA